MNTIHYSRMRTGRDAESRRWSRAAWAFCSARADRAVADSVDDRGRRGRLSAAGANWPVMPMVAFAAMSLGLVTAGCAAPTPGHGTSMTAASRHRADAGGLGPAGSAPYAVMLRHAFGSRPAVVVDMRTGRIAGRVRVPVAGSSFEWVAAEPGGRAFVLADESQHLVYRLYRLRLSRRGRPLPLARLAVPALRDAQVYGLSVTADGSELAIAAQTGPIGSSRALIEVVSLVTGKVRTWTSDRGAATSLSWDGNRTLAFSWQGTQAGTSGVRLLDTAAPGSNPLASRLLIPDSTKLGGLSNPVLQIVTTDRATIFASMSGGRHQDLVAIVAFSARSGRPLRIVTLASSTLGSTHQLLYCGVAWTDHTGRRLITQCGTSRLRIDGTKATRIRMPELPASPVGFANAFAW